MSPQLADDGKRQPTELAGELANARMNVSHVVLQLGLGGESSVAVGTAEGPHSGMGIGMHLSIDHPLECYSALAARELTTKVDGRLRVLTPRCQKHLSEVQRFRGLRRYDIVCAEKVKLNVQPKSIGNRILGVTLEALVRASLMSLLMPLEYVFRLKRLAANTTGPVPFFGIFAVDVHPMRPHAVGTQ